MTAAPGCWQVRPSENSRPEQWVLRGCWDGSLRSRLQGTLTGSSHGPTMSKIVLRTGARACERREAGGGV